MKENTTKKELIRDTVRHNMKLYREKINMTQKELAEQLQIKHGIDIKHNTVSNWENGKSSVDIDSLFMICDILGVSINDIYGDLCDNDGYPINPNKKNSITLDGKELSDLDMYFIEMYQKIPENQKKELWASLVSELKNRKLM